MEKQRTLFRSLAIVLVAAVLAVLVFPGLAFADWQKMDPPPDADKPGDGSRSNTCYQATAANMLAAAGYGDGDTVQERAEEIYDEIFAQDGNPLGGGWIDTALTWWLGSSDNTWAGSNPYTVVTVYGNKLPKYPWANVNGAQFIGNELRRCEMAGLSISWPTAGATIGTGGHAITAWGDSGDPPELTGNPAQVIVADSDRDNGGDVQTYSYDVYTNPNPGGPNEGNGWYIDYVNWNGDNAYIKHITTLCPTDDPTDYVSTTTVVGSEAIHQASETPATDLHYQVYTDVEILTYRTAIDWETENPPTIVEWEDDWDGRHWWGLTVDWDLSDNLVPHCSEVRITTEFVEPAYNSIYYKDKYFTYPFPGPPLPPFGWEIITPELDLDDIYLPNMTGGYVVGSLDIFADPEGQDLIERYRFLHEYDYFQDPELHYFTLEATNATPYYAGNLRFGHSYGFLEAEELWEFHDWMTVDDEILELYQYEPITVDLDWEGLLPYPLGDGPDFTLTVDSTAGGSVTTPGEGVFGYEEEEVVDLEATPDPDFDFVSWTGDVGTIATVGDATTTITMNGDYEITANFEYVGDGNGFCGEGILLPFALVSVGIVVTWATKRRRRVL